MLKFSTFIFKFKIHSRSFTQGAARMNIPLGAPPCNKIESEKMKGFQEKLKLVKIPRVSPSARFVELVLVTTDPRTGEIIADHEKNPTKWGDWQQFGRVADF